MKKVTIKYSLTSCQACLAGKTPANSLTDKAKKQCFFSLPGRRTEVILK
jgi:hypothetical protein